MASHSGSKTWTRNENCHSQNATRSQKPDGSRRRSESGWRGGSPDSLRKQTSRLDGDAPQRTRQAEAVHTDVARRFKACCLIRRTAKCEPAIVRPGPVGFGLKAGAHGCGPSKRSAGLRAGTSWRRQPPAKEETRWCCPAGRMRMLLRLHKTAPGEGSRREAATGLPVSPTAHSMVWLRHEGSPLPRSRSGCRAAD
jgi:hypothetical protein